MPAHSHTFTTAETDHGAEYHCAMGEDRYSTKSTSTTGGNQPHTHTVTATTKAVPPYYALYYIQRIR